MHWHQFNYKKIENDIQEGDIVTFQVLGPNATMITVRYKLEVGANFMRCIYHKFRYDVVHVNPPMRRVPRYPMHPGNNRIFNALSIDDRNDFCTEATGIMHGGGDWPTPTEIETLGGRSERLTKIVRALFDLQVRRNTDVIIALESRKPGIVPAELTVGGVW